MQTDETREGAVGLTVPFQTLLETVTGGNPLHHKAARGFFLGRRSILFGTVAYRWRRRTSRLRPGSMAMPTVLRQIERPELVEK